MAFLNENGLARLWMHITTALNNKVDVAIESIKPKRTVITLPAVNWNGNENPWHQVVHIDGVTTSSKINLYATALQVVDMQNNEFSLMAENDNGVVTVYALGNKPTSDYTIQAEITEVVLV